MNRVCVFCGSSPGRTMAYLDEARRLGTVIAERGLELVYGGASVGLMRAVADAVLEAGGRVTGVIPTMLVRKELAHDRVTDLRVVSSMHERKALMADLADAFIALPGGMGTLEEVCEVFTWVQLGLHAKPCGLLNVGGYYDGLLAFFDTAVSEGFLRPEHRRMMLVDPDPGSLLDRFAQYRAPAVAKWIEREQT